MRISSDIALSRTDVYACVASSPRHTLSHLVHLAFGASRCRKQPSWMGPLRYHNALGILSKYPLTDTQFHLFKSNVSLEAMMGTKGALVTTMLLPGHEGEVTPVKVQTTHAYHRALLSMQLRLWKGASVRMGVCAWEGVCVWGGGGSHTHHACRMRRASRSSAHTHAHAHTHTHTHSCSTSTSLREGSRTRRTTAATLFETIKSQSASSTTRICSWETSTLDQRRQKATTNSRCPAGAFAVD
jgi:hypothetical protein